MSFEEALKRIEEIVSRLEQGEVPLEESIVLYEEGAKLVKYCLGLLDKAEQKVKLLLREPDGSFATEDFPELRDDRGTIEE